MAMQDSLDLIPSGKNVLVVDLLVNRKERTRLESMGIIPGVEVGVLANAGGPILLTVGQSRLVVEKTIARNMIVF